jgi:hypothetical protein
MMSGSTPDSRAVDVVTVADFEGRAAARFELRTLLFLGAWIQHQGSSRTWPLHLVCIGEPPRSVQRLAKRAGASVSVHGPLVFNPRRNSNKLRAFDIAPTTDRLLLLDTDVVVLRDLSPLAALVGCGIGVGVATLNYLPEETWKALYETTGVPYPGATGTAWCADEHLASRRGLTSDQAALSSCMPPFFNSGVILAPWHADLGARWSRHHEQIVQFLQEHPTDWPGEQVISDEPALATAVEHLRLQGTPAVMIPWIYHTRPLLLRAGAVRWEDVAIFHYHNSLNPYAQTLGDLRQLLYGSRVRPPGKRLAGPAGRAAVRPSLSRRVPLRDLHAFAEFYTFLHRTFYSTLQSLWPDVDR